MPYPNEHAARIHDPKGYMKIRRENGKFGAGIDVIWGVKEGGKTEIQAIRFNSKKYTIGQVKDWLSKRGYKPIKIEAASDKPTTHGGSGSGNFGHERRPGEVRGSGGGGSSEEGRSV